MAVSTIGGPAEIIRPSTSAPKRVIHLGPAKSPQVIRCPVYPASKIVYGLTGPAAAGNKVVKHAA
ncbi:hypothetical protein [Paenibacillus macerans]|uniref:hypothetical protein n=1 Tax=Paenibacillus macerans TaxID=44252 RepID=UPI00203BDB9D|nr:hypothetical protein [Paenibacillus macerans]MCM3699190.1 hypothetical protein [Paenibacillus macerans]